MERLTFEGLFCDICQCIGEPGNTSECESGFCDQRRTWERLKEYEDKIERGELVEAVDVREFARDVVYQFGYYCQNRGRLHITHGGLSTLEQAFDILGWENPHPVPEYECEIDGCHEHATCGALTNDGYKRMCGKHCRERRTE